MEKICCGALALCLLLTVLFMNGEALGLEASSKAPGYASTLFDTGRVHTIDIVMDGWEDFLSTCENEEYAACDVVVDGEACKNVGLRAKGNTSLSSVSQMGSSRYSFKIEFDQYDSGKTYRGLDKLCLNNLIQDNTYMKDYLVYQLMAGFGVDAPLCSYAYITVNGEDWGLYLAVEGVEESFLRRSYGSGYGALYKPDSMDFGGGRGNGRGFDMDGFWNQQGQGQSQEEPGSVGQASPPGFPGGEGFEGMDFPEMGQPGQNRENPGGGFSPPGGGGFGGMGASDVKLQYIDDDPDSYENIFENAKTEISSSDEKRLIASLKSLSSYEDLESVLDTEEVLRYFVVHNFVVNGDSYTGSMIHNYYLYEQDGQLSMIPWDYNLAFGTFQAGSADSAVNDPIDQVLDDRPMQAWIFSDEEYKEQYHSLFAKFLDNAGTADLISSAQALIAPYVEKDPTRFCTYEEFSSGVQALQSFCALREQSVRGQLRGSIPATEEAQSADSSALVDASQITLSDMGSMGGMGGGGDFSPGSFPAGNTPPEGEMPGEAPGEETAQAPENGAPEQPPENEAPEQAPGESGAQDSGQLPGKAGGFPQPGGQEAPAESPGQTLLLLGVSALILALGLLFAKKFRA